MTQLTRQQLALLLVRWEGGEVVDTLLLLRELAHFFWEVEAEKRD